MADPTARTLHLLALLQARSGWSAAELAQRIGTTERSLRRDITRLRDLGYPVVSTSGVGGGYRLGAGRSLPPLMLDAAEAVAVVVALRQLASESAGAGEAALTAAAKLDAVMPKTLRENVAALQDAIAIPETFSEETDGSVLLLLARAIRNNQVCEFTYERADSVVTQRFIEPYRLVPAVGRWYLFTWDLDRHDWRTFRVDRATSVRCSRAFYPRDTPDPVAHVLAGLGQTQHALPLVVDFDAPAARVRALIPARIGRVEAVAAQRCTFFHEVTDPKLTISRMLGIASHLECTFTIREPAKLIEHLSWLRESLALSQSPDHVERPVSDQQ